MTAPVQIGAAKIATDTAGHTSGELPHTTTQVATVLEQITADGGFASMLSGGVHPDAPIGPIIGAPLHKATDSITGPHGGLSPLRNGVLANGPAGGAAAVAEVQRVTTDNVAKARSWLGRQVEAVRMASKGGPGA